MLVSIKFFLISQNNKIYAPVLWKGETFGRNCSSFGSNEDNIFHFHPAQFWCRSHDTCKVFAEKSLWLGFQEDVDNDIFRFLLNLKFQRKPRLVSCVDKTIRFSKVGKPFRVLICGLLQKTKNCLAKNL